MRHWKWLLVLCTAAVGGCSSGNLRSHDSICTEIAAFAKATPAGETREIVLRGGWGGDTPGVLMTHDCTHGGYASGAQLCEYLIPNTSWEFGSRNATRAAACLLLDESVDFDNAWASGEATTVSGRLRDFPGEPVIVSLGLEAAGTYSNLSVLTISAARAGN